MPVSGSTSTSTMWRPNALPTPPGFAVARPTMGPPVALSRWAICFSVIFSSGSSLWLSSPFANSTSALVTSHMVAARSINWLRTSSAAWYTAVPILNVTPLPPAPEL